MAVGAAVGAVAIGGFFKSTISAASDAQQSIGGTQAVFGKFSGAVIKQSAGAAKQFGLSANEYRENANIIGSLLKNQGVSLDQLGGKTKNMIGLSSDLAATFGGKTSDAVNALAAAYKGEFDPLQNYGITLKQSTINTEAMRVANVKSTAAFNKLSSAQQQSAIRQATTNLIMGQSKSALGQFGKQTNTLAEQQQILGAQFDNLKVTVGTAVLPIVTKFFSYLTSTGVPAVSTFVTQMHTGVGAGGQFAAILGGIGSAVSSTIGFLNQHKAAVASLVGGYLAFKVAQLGMTAVQAVSLVVLKAQTVGTLEQAIASRVAGVASKVWAAGQWLLNAALTANPIGLVVAAIAGLVVGFVVAYKHSATFRAIVTGAFNAVKTAVSAAVGVIKKVVPAAFAFVVSIVRGYVNAYRAIVVTAFNVVKRVVTAAMNVVKAVVSRVLAAVLGVFSRQWAAAKAVTSRMMAAIRSVVSSGMNAAKSVVSRVMAAIKSAFTSAWNAIRSATVAAFNRIRSAVSDGIGKIVALARGMGGKLVSAVSGLAGRMYSAGAALIGGLVRGIEAKMGAAISAVRNGLHKIAGLLPGSPIKWGPLKSWNNGGAGKRLVGFLADGLSDSRPVESAMERLSSRIAVRAPSVHSTISGSDISGSKGVAARGGLTVEFSGNVYAHDPDDLVRKLNSRISAAATRVKFG